MRIAFVGAGGVGGYFGARLAAAGEDVAFLARGAHLEAIRREGLRILSGAGDACVFPEASDDPAALAPAEIVVVAVKNFDTEEAGRAAARLVAPDGELLSLQNGVEAWDVLAGILGRPALGGVAYITAVIERPGVIRHNGMLAGLALGAFDRRPSSVAERFRDACLAAKVDARIPDDITAAIWEKFVFLTSFSAVTALARLSIGPIREDPEARALFERAMREAEAVAHARGIALPEDVVARRMTVTDRLPPDSVASMAHDLARGNRLELPWLSGAVVRMGRALGVPTPIHETAAALLGPFTAGDRGNRD
jgi:2-dehydropantoate 2-reductase